MRVRGQDVPGLVAEAATTAELMDKLAVLIPELLELNAAHLLDEGFSPVSERHFPVDHKIVSRHTANAIMKQAGLARRFR